MKKVIKRAAALLLALLCVFPAYAAGPGEAAGGSSAAAGTKVSASLSSNSVKTSQLDNFQYYLYSPKNPTENMAMIVYLHGHGTPDLKNLGKNKVFVDLMDQAAKKEGAYILAPLLPPEYDLGSKGMWPAIESSLLELVNAVADAYQIDRSRISLAGCSMGADASIQIAAHHPDVFSCITGIVPYHIQCPIAKWEDSWAAALKNVPVWMFIEDEETAIQKAETARDAIIAAGGQSWVDVQHGADHGAATRQALDSSGWDIYSWMISVSKPQADTPL